MKPEESARIEIDRRLEETGWVVQDMDRFNPNASMGVAVREFMTSTGPVDYVLFVDRKPVGIIEAKASKYGCGLTIVEQQTERYHNSSLKWGNDIEYNLRFEYQCTDKRIMFTDRCDEKARARDVYRFMRPETLSELMRQKETFRNRLKQMPPLDSKGLRVCQYDAVSNLEKSFASNKPRALIQMATGAGKTYTAITASYRLLKYAHANRILFLVDTKNLGVQAYGEYRSYKPQDETRLFTELYSVYNITSSNIPKDANICICTIQRIYSLLTGKKIDDIDEECPIPKESASDIAESMHYSSKIPVEFFDVIIVDECHRSIYNVWSQVLEYFDSFLIGLTATPDKRTFGFFNKNIVSEYTREQAIIDNVNVGEDVYTISTDITVNGASISSPEVEKRNRLTREKRWSQLDEPIEYKGKELDKSVVNESQIRTIIRETKKVMFTTLFPYRKEVPKTLIFAKDDSHADDIVRIVREEYNEGNEFCVKITYRADDPERLLNSFRNGYYPRIAVTVDMIATGTDVKPIECLVFMRDVHSRNYFEQMVGRGTRTMSKEDLKKVTPSASSNKSHFVIIDAVGVTKSIKTEARVLIRNPTKSLRDLMGEIVMGSRNEDTFTTLAGRLTRMQNSIGKEELESIESISKIPLSRIIGNLLRPFDEDQVMDEVLGQFDMGEKDERFPEKMAAVKEEMFVEAVEPFYNPDFRLCLEDIYKQIFQMVDRDNDDTVVYSGWSKDRTENADLTISNFKQFIQDNEDEIHALGVFYSVPYEGRIGLLKAVKGLYGKMKERNLTVEGLWNAYAVKGLCTPKDSRSELTDVVSFIRYELRVSTEIVPFYSIVDANFKKWVFTRNAGSIHFTEEQMMWLRSIKNHIINSLSVEMDDFDLMPFSGMGGRGRFASLFPDYANMITELNNVLVQ